jgi:hypothetical protein
VRIFGDYDIVSSREGKGEGLNCLKNLNVLNRY